MYIISVYVMFSIHTEIMKSSDLCDMESGCHTSCEHRRELLEWLAVR